ncbi:MAG: DNA-3-methyladenine glycosylase [Actinomycetales bacterium]|nr:DNA-3-methyladenine glycosylase [Actinomycetales bacterium]
MRDLLNQHPSAVAPQLLGGIITSCVDGVRVRVRLTEVEAYGGQGEDPGSHAFRRESPRNATMFGPPGRAYVYFTYGMHWCLNVVAHEPGLAGAVLLRAGEVIEGVAEARARRGRAVRDRDLARGPARLTVALGVTGELDDVSLLSRRSPLRLALPTGPVGEFGISARTGVGGDGAATPWRFHLPEEPTVSPYRPAQTRRR